jgi:hypothetical protein
MDYQTNQIDQDQAGVPDLRAIINTWLDSNQSKFTMNGFAVSIAKDSHYISMTINGKTLSLFKIDKDGVDLDSPACKIMATDPKFFNKLEYCLNSLYKIIKEFIATIEYCCGHSAVNSIFD